MGNLNEDELLKAILDGLPLLAFCSSKPLWWNDVAWMAGFFKFQRLESSIHDHGAGGQW